jgi:anti-sigma factor RsiW
MEATKNICAGMETKLADLLLEPEAAPAEVREHVAGCEACRRELEELRATMALMDDWTAPEPNPYFMTRFEARLREEKQAKPASWLERVRARFLYGSKMQVRPLAAMALTVLVLLGGGAYLDVYWAGSTAATPQTAVVHDLQTLDNNAQLLDQLATISGDEDQNDQN